MCNLKDQKGQTLIIVLLVMIMALAMGIVISERLLRSTRRSTQIDSSARALAVSEAAMERILLTPNSTLESYIDNNSCGSSCQLTITGTDGVVANASVTLAYSGNSVSGVTVDIDKNTVYEIDLADYPDNTPVELCWDNATFGYNPSIYVTHVYSSTPFSVVKYAYNSASTVYSSNGFSASAPDLTYPNCATIPGKSSQDLIRVRALYNNVRLYVVPKNGATLPIQGYLITSVGFVNNVKRTVTAMKTKSYLPAEFDFALFNTSTSEAFQN
ncbi:hypothetical protein HY419_00770 [candidate division WWE3 bacterium]|nr:hypothetical protein [candidate division WWE3 bacterium]